MEKGKNKLWLTVKPLLFLGVTVYLVIQADRAIEKWKSEKAAKTT